MHGPFAGPTWVLGKGGLICGGNTGYKWKADPWEEASKG